MKSKSMNIVLVGLFAALTAIGAFISIPVGPVPITLQSLFVILVPSIFGAKLAVLSQVVYILLGLIGLPIFAGFSGGLGSIFKPSFGFLIGFILASFIIGKLSENSNRSRGRIFIALIMGSIAIYLVGLPYMYYIMNKVLNLNMGFYDVLRLGCLLFLPGDFLKVLIVTYIAPKIIAISN